jgi:hypothetical protein
MRLTDRSLATNVTKEDLIHIVITGDTSQSPEGSSYKAKIGQIPELYKLPVPTLKLEALHSGNTILVSTLNSDNTVGPDVKLINPPIIIVDNLTQEQLNDHVFIEMVQYKKKKGRKNHYNPKGGGYVIQPRMEDDGFGNTINVLQQRIMYYYGKTILTRGGIQTDCLTNLPLAVNRGNHYEISYMNQITELVSYFYGRFTYINLEYINSTGIQTYLSNVPVPYTNWQKSVKQKTKSGNTGTPYKLCYFGNMSSLYIAFRYLMFDPEANNGKGQFVEGPLSQTIKVCNQFFPVIKTATNGRCNVNPKFTAGTNNTLIKFSFVN